MNARRSWFLLLIAVLALLATACGDDDGGDTAEQPTTDAATDDDSDTADDDSDTADDDSSGADDDAEMADDDMADDDGAEATPSAGGGGTLVLGDETITLDSARCFLEEQDAAAGGGKILFVGQGSGTNADGTELLLDVSRYDEESQFTGDDITVDIGDPFSDDLVSYRAAAEIGTVQIDGSVMSADGLTFSNFDLGEELPGSFQLNC
ncbi:MAG: hypothetical protein RIB98_16160 [Acidimicrobiales bacterium]